jgi:hypothetical protein
MSRAKPKSTPQPSENEDVANHMNWMWMQSTVDKDKWATVQIPPGECMCPYIKRSSRNQDGSHTFFVYRDGKYIDCTNDLEDAKKIAKRGKMRPERLLGIKAVRDYMNNTPNDKEAFLKLGRLHQQAILETFPNLAPRLSSLKKEAENGGEKVDVAMVAKAVSKGNRRVTNMPEGTIKLIRKRNFRSESDISMQWEILYSYVGKTVADFIAGRGNPAILKSAILAGCVVVEP